MKRPILALLAGLVLPLKPAFAGLKPRRVEGRRMISRAVDSGTYHGSVTGAVYFQPNPKRSYFEPVLDKSGEPMRDEDGMPIEHEVWKPEPWTRVTEKPKRPGAERRAWLREQRAA